MRKLPRKVNSPFAALRKGPIIAWPGTGIDLQDGVDQVIHRSPIWFYTICVAKSAAKNGARL